MLSIKDLIFPKTCPICDRVHRQYITRRSEDEPVICEDCESTLTRIEEPFCVHCGKPFEEEETERELCYDCEKTKDKWSYIQGRALFLYTGALTQSMYRLKYAGKRNYGAMFAREAVEQLGDWIRSKKVDAIIPIPLHEERFLERGYNQAEDISDELAKLLGIKMDAKILTRIKKTVPQKELDDKNRANNLKNAFHIGQIGVKYNRVLLVDDIYTTGATLSTAAQCLLDAGIKEIYCLCVAIGSGA